MTFLGHKNTPYYKIQKKIRFDENFFCIDKNEGNMKYIYKIKYLRSRLVKISVDELYGSH